MFIIILYHMYYTFVVKEKNAKKQNRGKMQRDGKQTQEH
jgi:hypothetical protein